MDVFAIIEIVNVVLKCVIVFCLVWFPNRLIAYGGLTFVISVIISLLYAVYCIKRLEGFEFSNKFHKGIIKEMTILQHAIYLEMVHLQFVNRELIS